MQSWLEDCSYTVLDFNAPGSLTTRIDRQTNRPRLFGRTPRFPSLSLSDNNLNFFLALFPS